MLYTPHTATLYKLNEANNGSVTIDITFLSSCLLQRAEAARATTRGLTGSDSATLYIPFSCKAEDGLTKAAKTWVTPKEYEAAASKTNIYTIADDGSCYFVLGKHIEAGATFKELNAKYGDVFKVTGVRVCDYGTDTMRHFEVTGA